MNRVLAAALIAALFLAGCTSSGGGGDPVADKVGLTQYGAMRALLDGSQVGPGLQAKTGKIDELLLPCTPKAGSLDSQFHPRAHAVTSYTDDLDSFQFTEIVTTYAGLATAKQALAAVEAGLSCQDAYVSRFAAQITGPLKVTLPTPTDKIELWSIKTSIADQSIIVARLGNQLIQLIFAAAGAVQAKVDTASIAKAAVARVSSTLSSS